MTNYEKLMTDREILIFNLICPRIPEKPGTGCYEVGECHASYDKHCKPCIGRWLDEEAKEDEG